MNKRIQKKKIRELLLVELAHKFGNTEDAVEWLERPNDQLDGQTPRQAISAGEAARVALLLEKSNASS